MYSTFLNDHFEPYEYLQFSVKTFFLQAREGPWELFHSAEVICLQQDLFSPEKEKEEITHTCEL